jgi:hypothetical protein
MKRPFVLKTWPPTTRGLDLGEEATKLEKLFQSLEISLETSEMPFSGSTQLED